MQTETVFAPNQKRPVRVIRCESIPEWVEQVSKNMTDQQRIREMRTSANGYWSNHYFVPTNRNRGVLR
jgi:hypothetical protein